MHEENFIKENIGKWEKLEEYNKSRKRLINLSKQQLQEYEHLIKITGYHLAYAKTFFPEGRVVDYLNQIIGSANSKFYAKEKLSFKNILEYFRQIPQKFQKIKAYFYASMGVFLTGFLFVLILAAYDSAIPGYFFGGISEDVGLLSNETWYYPTLSAFIMTNNIRVCIMAYVLGVFFGIGTVLILLYNGMIIGALYSQVIFQGISHATFWSLILPHGFIELTAIFLSGGLGILMGKSLLIPGKLSRKNSFVKAAKEGVYFIPLIVVMLIIAGLIEGFFTPLNISEWIKLAFSVITLILTILYFRVRKD